MSTLSISKILGFVAVCSLVACAAPAEESVGSSSTGLGGAATAITFGADWSVSTDGVLTAGTRVKVIYDEARMPVCRGDVNGAPAWTVTGHYRVGGGAEATFEAAGFRPSGGKGPAEIDLPPVLASSVEMWFEIGNRWGCHEWDSAYGKNFRFDLASPKGAPRWAGNLQVMSERQTCDGGRPCESLWRPLTNDGYDFGTWTRQRAAITQLAFQVYEPGKTDWDNPDLWRQLDVRLYWRVGATGPFQMRHVAIDRRVGNDTRYTLSTRELDPFKLWNTPQKKSDCPAFPMTQAGPYVHADVQFYLWINGAELRPRPGDVFHGRYEEYGGPFAICF
jgi:hypothetical protein